MTSKTKVISLFTRYGFEHREAYSGTGFVSFTYRSGFFYNAEIVSLHSWEKNENDANLISAIKTLEKSGFSTKYKIYKSFEDLEETLFRGFFNYDKRRERSIEEYIRHCEKSLEAFPKNDDLNYEYIDSNYEKNDIHHEGSFIRDVMDSLSMNGPVLTIIEAPAGFGKTCSSYEIVHQIATDSKRTIIPFFSEFSRDRQARVFSHILIREVDRSFAEVNSEVVIEEISKGRIVVILDGFDELLQEDSVEESENSQFESAEPMLETISELLIGHAKIVLTSRRSAMFDGASFNEWLGKHDAEFSVNRFRLQKPTVADWLTRDRQDKLLEASIDLETLANPVILTYLRYLKDEAFKRLVKSPDKIVETFIHAMLEREMERQNLAIPVEKQATILSSIANHMCMNGYDSDTKENIVELILSTSSEILKDARTTYSPAQRPSMERLATTLSQHAFLDRCDEGENIRFVNEFVFGTFIGRCAASEEDWMAHDERFVEPAVLAYVPRSNRHKENLWKGLQSMLEFLPASDQARFEFLLTNQLSGSRYSEKTIRNIRVSNLTLFPGSQIRNSVFYGCEFFNVELIPESLIDITFINCEFWECTLSGKLNEANAHFINSGGDSNFAIRQDENAENGDAPDPNRLSKIEIYILMKFFNASTLSAERLQIFIGLVYQTENFSKREIEKSIRALRKRGLLMHANDHKFISLNKEEIGRIKQLLSSSNG